MVILRPLTFRAQLCNNHVIAWGACEQRAPRRDHLIDDSFPAHSPSPRSCRKSRLCGNICKLAIVTRDRSTTAAELRWIRSSLAARNVGSARRVRRDVCCNECLRAGAVCRSFRLLVKCQVAAEIIGERWHYRHYAVMRFEYLGWLARRVKAIIGRDWDTLHAC